MNEDEKVVRESWERVTYSESGLTPAGPNYVTISDLDHPTAGSLLFMKHGASKEAVFAAARAFTVERKRQIAEIEEEVMETEAWAKSSYATARQKKIRQRILDSRIAARDELTKGMRRTQ